MSKVSFASLMFVLMASAYPAAAFGQSTSRGCGCSNVTNQPIASNSQAYQYSYAPTGVQTYTVGSVPMESQPMATMQSYPSPVSTIGQYNQSGSYRRFSYQPSPARQSSYSSFGNQRYLYPKADHRRYDSH